MRVSCELSGLEVLHNNEPTGRRILKLGTKHLAKCITVSAHPTRCAEVDISEGDCPVGPSCAASAARADLRRYFRVAATTK